MISAYFNTTLDAYYQDDLGSRNHFDSFSFTGKKTVSSAVLLRHKALTRSHFTSIQKLQSRVLQFHG